MDEDTLNHILNKFYQKESSRNDYGNGLGLAIVKRITEITDIGIEVNSVKNEGVNSYSIYNLIKKKQTFSRKCLLFH